MPSFNKDLVVETPTSGFVLTSNVCLNFPLEIYGRTFLIDLICLPLSQIDVILGMDWLSSNHVLLNYFDKTMEFDGSGVSKDMMFIFANEKGGGGRGSRDDGGGSEKCHYQIWKMCVFFFH